MVCWQCSFGPYDELEEEVDSLEDRFPQQIGEYSYKLPQWLENYLFDELGAKYMPDHDRFSYNLDLNINENKIYLGTYFPRSCIECYTIFSSIFTKSNYASQLQKESLTLFDFGCGSGGDMLGTLLAIEQFLPTITKVSIVAVDGNKSALVNLDKLFAKYKENSRLNVELEIFPFAIEGEKEIKKLLDYCSIIGIDKFDFFLTSKAICEFVSKNLVEQNAYTYFATLFAPLLSQQGIMTFVDVTIPIESIGNRFLPYYMFEGLNDFEKQNSTQYKTVLPLSCHNKATICNTSCFSQHKIYVSHRGKTNDLTKITYRMIARLQIANALKFVGVPKDIFYGTKCNVNK